MKILLVAATKHEIEPIQHYLAERIYLRKHQHIDVLITGVGSLAASYALSKEIAFQKPDIAIQAGIGGSFHPLFCPGKMVAIKEDVIGDLGVMQNNKWHSLVDLGFIGEDDHPWKNGKLINPYKDLLNKLELEKVNAITVNRISTEEQFIQEVKEKYSPIVESMEGAAFHYVCLKESIPFIQLRSISNMVGERDKSKWLLKESIEVLNNELIRLLNQLTDPI